MYISSYCNVNTPTAGEFNHQSISAVVGRTHVQYIVLHMNYKIHVLLHKMTQK